MKTLRLIIVISCCMVSSYAQPATDSTGLMHKLLLIEHRIWLAGHKDTCNMLLFEKARLLKQAHMLEWSYRELCRIEVNSKISNELFYEKALNSFLRGDFGGSYNQLSNIPDSVRMGSKPCLFLWMLTLTELNKWEECKSIMSEMALSGKIKEDELTVLPTMVKYKSPEKAHRLSSYLPGLGQIYTGNWGKGVASLVIHAGLLWFTYQQYATSYYITGTFAGVYPIFRFYPGGKNLSYNLAVQYNETHEWKTRQQYQKVIRELLE
jgi:hypothetical protein